MVSEQFDPSGVLPPFPPSSFGFAPAIPTPLLFRFAPAISATPSSFDSMATAPSTTPYFTAPYSFPARNPHPFPFPFFSPPPPLAPTPTPFTAPSAFGSPASGSPPIPPPPAYPYAYTAAPAYDVPPPPPQAYYYPPPTNPYLPSASAYTPASGFSPLPPPVPNPTPPTASQIHGDLHAPPQESTAPPPTGAPGSTSPSTQPWVASSPSPGLASGPIFIPTTASASKMQPDPAPLFEPFDAFHTSTSRRQPDHAPAANPKHSSLLKLPGRDVSSSCPTFLASREVQAREEATISKNMPRAVLDLKRRLDEQQARDRNSFGSLQGELANLMSMAAQLAVSIGKLSSSAHASNLEQSRQSPVLQNTSSPACTDTIPKPSATPSSSPRGATDTKYVAPQLFGEMPKPNSGHGTLVMAPGYEDCCYGYPNQIQSSCVQGGSSNPCEHYLDGQPHHYGFDNLKRQSVFRADGTEHSYYALPTDYPLERATPAPRLAAGVVEMDVCSAELVDIFVRTPEQQTFERKLVYEDNAYLNSVDDVFAPTTEQQPYEEEKRGSGQALKCFSKTTFSGEKPTVCTVGIFSLKDDARACNYSVLKASNSVATRSIQLSTEHCKRELRLLWDPGALLPLMSSTTQHYSPALQPASDATAQGRRDAAAVYKVFILQLPMSTNSLVWDPGIDTPSSIYFWLQDLSATIATRKPLPWLQISELAAWRSQVASASYVWDPGTESLLFLCKLLHIRMIQLVDSTSTTSHACYFFLVARLPPTQVASYCLSNIKVVELTSRYLVFHPNQIDSWASTISNGIASSEYAYRLDFHYDQWEFFNQQDVHENCSAKHLLLSSQKYLLLREMDIIFITYLPP